VREKGGKNRARREYKREEKKRMNSGDKGKVKLIDR